MRFLIGLLQQAWHRCLAGPDGHTTRTMPLACQAHAATVLGSTYPESRCRPI